MQEAHLGCKTPMTRSAFGLSCKISVYGLREISGMFDPEQEHQVLVSVCCSDANTDRRLRFSFVDVKPKPDQKGDAPVKMGKSPILASVFSDVFTVYSAKKFPGVCDSTELSKCFATQGIKIPIRKEGAKGGDNDDDDDD